VAFIHTAGLHKEYGSTAALRGVDLDIDELSWCAIMGPSGSGKSTLLNILGGLEGPTSGRVEVAGMTLAGLGEDELARYRRETIGLIFQQSHLLPQLDAVENVMLAQHFHSMTDEAEATEALRRIGLEGRLHHRPAQLSGGERQRVGIARALINRPRLLLADEPTGNLDRENTRLILELLRELYAHQQLTIVLVTHDPYVAEWAGRVLTLVDGKIADDELRVR